MKPILFILSSLLYIQSFGQSSFLKDAAAKLDKALLEKDSVTLKQLLHKDATYGHSNGWVETRADVIIDISSGKLAYNKIESTDSKWTVTKDVATLRTITQIGYALEGKPGELKLHVVQVWLKTNKGWQLLVRQGTKI